MVCKRWTLSLNASVLVVQHSPCPPFGATTALGPWWGLYCLHLKYWATNSWLHLDYRDHVNVYCGAGWDWTRAIKDFQLMTLTTRPWRVLQPANTWEEYLYLNLEVVIVLLQSIPFLSWLTTWYFILPKYQLVALCSQVRRPFSPISSWENVGGNFYEKTKPHSDPSLLPTVYTSRAAFTGSTSWCNHGLKGHDEVHATHIWYVEQLIARST